ncbi:Rrf2 family transcriptional regulator [Limnohabitans sp. 2KL-51]|jgi:Rrf2 family protein|uniref:RrF2 family transcriptional regulator n=2 Tax=unclassified Limnohabitans TaxID=2626134 RepID=UPI000D38770A|nr:Rrf2 family transcriptional regulator [Limnohabitans sp. 2KL-51]PUE48321.1 transcriptional regulator [Limnohabitans sp. 2KL-51]
MIQKKTVKALDIAVFITSRAVVKPVTTEEIANGLGLSSSYTESILKELREADLIRAHRGPGGGYQIRGNPEDISLWDVVQHFEELHSFDVLYPDGDHPMKALESDIQSNMQALLQAQTLSDVAVPFMPTDARLSSMLGQFRLKPLPAPVMPRAPNSVFQLSMMM